MAASRRLTKISRVTENAVMVLEDRTNDVVAVKVMVRELMSKLDDIYNDLGDAFSGNVDVDARNITSSNLLPTSDRGLTSGKLWNNRGVVTVKT